MHHCSAPVEPERARTFNGGSLASGNTWLYLIEYVAPKSRGFSQID